MRLMTRAGKAFAVSAAVALLVASTGCSAPREAGKAQPPSQPAAPAAPTASNSGPYGFGTQVKLQSGVQYELLDVRVGSPWRIRKSEPASSSTLPVTIQLPTFDDSGYTDVEVTLGVVRPVGHSNYENALPEPYVIADGKRFESLESTRHEGTWVSNGLALHADSPYFHTDEYRWVGRYSLPESARAPEIYVREGVAATHTASFRLW